MSGKRNAIGLVAALTSLVAAVPAQAQNISNEVWLGQVGGLNSVDVNQEGRGNALGANFAVLLLQQDGIGNALTSVQKGYSNKIGTLFADVPGYARGVSQRGDLNIIDITQTNSAFDGSNTIGAIQQTSAYSLPVDSLAYNSLKIVQTAENDGSGIAGHYIGRVVQENTGAATAGTNSVSIEQTGGGADLGNSLSDLRQTGSGNSFASIQSGQQNWIGAMTTAGVPSAGGVVQEGVGNGISVTQSGTQNIAEYLEQYGARNIATIVLDDQRNVLAQVLQNNQSWGDAGAGNRVVLSISGSDNGGTGNGWVGELLLPSTLAVPGIAQATVTQIGDDNDISLAILSGTESKYGFTQVGDGNGVIVSFAGAISGATVERNETAIFQHGETNFVSHTVSGSDNAAAIKQEGNRNALSVSQHGQFGLVQASVIGHDNNGAASSLFGGALLLANAITDVSLVPGAVFQTGTAADALGKNTIDVAASGSTNAFAFYQNGESNTLTSTVTGTDNALVVVQENQSNTALLAQSGSTNSFAVYQF